MSGTPNSARRPTANRSISTASRPPASPSRCCRTLTRSRSPNEVKAKMDELAKAFPQGLSYVVPYNTTKFVKAAISEVYRTLIEAAILVLIVILVFLQDWRAMLVPATTVPVTIIGAFAAMAALGFSINLPDSVRDRARDRHRRRRRDRHRRRRGAICRGRDARSRGGGSGDGRSDRTGPRHHARADVGVPSRRVSAGLTGQLYRQFALVIAVDSLHQRRQRADLQAHPKRVMAEAAKAS